MQNFLYLGFREPAHICLSFSKTESGTFISCFIQSGTSPFNMWCSFRCKIFQRLTEPSSLTVSHTPPAYTVILQRQYSIISQTQMLTPGMEKSKSYIFFRNKNLTYKLLKQWVLKNPLFPYLISISWSRWDVWFDLDPAEVRTCWNCRLCLKHSLPFFHSK